MRIAVGNEYPHEGEGEIARIPCLMVAYRSLRVEEGTKSKLKSFLVITMICRTSIAYQLS
jgi:hypothetical protein